MKLTLKPLMLATLITILPIAGVAHVAELKTSQAEPLAQISAAVKEDQAQLREDKAVLRTDEKQLKTDRAAMRADANAGKMAALSKDADKIYLDKQYIEGQRKDIEADQRGFMQMKADKLALKKEQRQLRAELGALPSACRLAGLGDNPARLRVQHFFSQVPI